ncbi:MAG: BolA family protein [Pseudomonadota bacterium]
MGPLEQSINQKLRDTFAPIALEVINESHLHAGHQGGAMDGTGETHFRVRIAADAFQTMTRLQRHRAVNDALTEELANGVHALAVEPITPD